MPVSHLGLTVSHIPSATSFYLAALHPLGYRFLGHQGNSIGLGVVSADFFLTQSPLGARISPNHIAFLAEDRSVVRECYAAALNSGGQPSGSPNYRNENCTCFNAAVEDLDGNTVEFIFRQPHGESGCCGEVAPESEQASIQDEEYVEDAVEEDSQSIVRSVRSQAPRSSRAKSSIQTAFDLASTASKSLKSEAPIPGISRTNTAPASSNFPSRTLVGTALGAAAGAALMYAMGRAERANAKDEADHAAYMTSKRRSRSETRQIKKESGTMPPPPPPPHSFRTRSVAPNSYPAPPSVRNTRKPHRNFSTTESAFSTRRPAPQTTQAMRMLEATGHNENEDIQQALGRYNSLRAMPTRSKTSDDYVYAPTSQAGRSESRRFSRLPMENYELLQDSLDGPKSTVPRQNRTRLDQAALRSTSQSSPSPSSSRPRRVSHDDTQLHRRNDSGVSVHSSSRQHQHHHRERGSESGQSGTMKTTPRRDSALIPSPHSKTPSLLIETAAYFPAAISLPASSIASSSRREGKRNAVLPPPPPFHHSEQSWEQFTAGEESDGLGDGRTVVPEDSISCVDLSTPPRRRRRRTAREIGEGSESGARSQHHHHSRHGSSRRRSSEASESTVKPVRRGTVVGEGKKRIFGL